MNRRRHVNAFPVVEVAGQSACASMILLLVCGNISSATSPGQNAHILLIVFI